jgi:hypothetical protein
VLFLFLFTVVIQFSLNWQHSRCDPKDPNPQMLDNSLFVDHRCRVSNVAQKTSDSTPTRNVLEKSASTPTIPSQTQSPPAQVQAQSQPQQQQNLRKRPYNETNNVSETERDNSDLLQALKVKRPRSDDLSTEPPPLPTHLFTTIFFHEVRTLVMRFHPTNTSLLLSMHFHFKIFSLFSLSLSLSFYLGCYTSQNDKCLIFRFCSVGIDAPSSRGAIVLYDVHQNKKLASIPSPSVKQLLWLPGGKEFGTRIFQIHFAFVVNCICSRFDFVLKLSLKSSSIKTMKRLISILLSPIENRLS